MNAFKIHSNIKSNNAWKKSPKKFNEKRFFPQGCEFSICLGFDIKDFGEFELKRQISYLITC